MQNYRSNKIIKLASRHTVLGVLVLVAVVALSLLSFLAREVSADPNTGAIWTTDAGGVKVNQNIYTSKQAVYLNGGPKSSGNGESGLEDGNYHVKVTEPDGVLLGSSGSSTVPVVDGILGLVNLYQLTNFANTTNPGGEYKVWVSKNIEFPNNESKTDNFKVIPDPTPTPTTEPTATPTNEPSPTPTDPGETQSPTPTPTETTQPTATPTPTDSGIGGGGTTTASSNQSSTHGQVLGATTLATTGTFEDSLYFLSFGTGIIFLGLGIMKYARLQK